MFGSTHCVKHRVAVPSPTNSRISDHQTCPLITILETTGCSLPETDYCRLKGLLECLMKYNCLPPCVGHQGFLWRFQEPRDELTHLPSCSHQNLARKFLPQRPRPSGLFWVGLHLGITFLILYL